VHHGRRAVAAVAVMPARQLTTAILGGYRCAIIDDIAVNGRRHHFESTTFLTTIFDN
jgi:hypothetical protein